MTFFWTLLILAIIAGVYVGIAKNRRLARGTGPNVIVETVKGDHAAQRRIAFMIEHGYQLQQQGSRKVVWSPLTGVFTRKQKHTLTFVKRPV